jgi:protocatechuate 3,4-dioxygenase beta subunit
MRWLVSMFVALALIALGLWLFQGSREALPIAAPNARAPRSADAPASSAVEATATPASERAPAVSESPAPTSAAKGAFELRVRGRCVDTQQRPIAGAQVECWIYYWAADLAGLEATREYDALPNDTQPRVHTDAQGRFELGLAPSKGEAAGAFRLRLRLTAAQRASANVELDLARGPDASADAGDVVLPLAGSLRGRVVDDHGAPVAKTRVSAWPKSVPEGRWTVYPAKCVDDGSFEIAGAPPGKLELGAHSDDMRVSKRLQLELAEGETRDGLELVLPALDDANSISGIVLSPKGEPVPRAQMRLVLRPVGGQGSGFSSFGCDADGRFRRELRSGDARLTAEDRDGLYGGAALENIQPGMHGLRVQLPPVAMLELHAEDEHGPVERFGWAMKREISQDSFEGSVPVPEAPRPEGRAQIRAPIEPFYVELQAAGYRSLELGPFRAEALPAEALFKLQPALGIHGSVSAEGKPLAGARVELWEALEPGRGGSVDNLPARMLPIDDPPHAESAQDGSFLLPVDRPGRYHVRAAAQGLAPAVSDVLDYDPAAGLRDVALALSRGGGIEGRDFAADGSPRAAQWIAASDGWPPASGSKTDAQGAFRFEHLAPGRYRLFELDRPIPAQPNSWGTGMPQGDLDTRFDCEVREGELTHFDLRAPQPAELVLSFPPEFAALGEWNVRAHVAGNGLARQGTSSWSEKHDELHVQFPAAGKCTLYLALPSDSHGPDRCTIAGTLELPPGMSTHSLGFGSGRIQVTLAPGKEPGAPIRLYAQIGTNWNFGANGIADANGRLEFPCVPAGKCQLMRGGESTWREVEVKAGETALVENF